jgi:lipopolysaccharide/colanic/teichoic acid biosynthesis glycosyltransferase
MTSPNDGSPVKERFGTVIATPEFLTSVPEDQFMLASSHEIFMPSQSHPSATNRIKRLIDIAGALIGLTVTAMFLIPLAVAIQLDNPGPIFYSQLRCGLNGRTFRIWKFRSMVVGAERLKHLVSNEAKGNIFKNRNDPRITKVGRFIRRTSLDEFPQFWNVLKGEMSLVGTRPPTVDEVMKYEKHHFQRLLVKPGITGEWQANGRSQVEDFEQIVAMDIAYQRKWSVFYDLLLIFKTLKAVFAKSGAY